MSSVEMCIARSTSMSSSGIEAELVMREADARADGQDNAQIAMVAITCIYFTVTVTWR